MNQSNVKLECKGLLLKVLVWGLPPFCFVLIQLEINWIIEVVVECVWDVNPSMRGRGTDDNALFAVNGICNWKLIDKKGREEKSGTYTALRLQLWIMTRYHSGRLRCSGPSQSWSELQPAIQSPNHSCFAILCLSSKKVMTHFRPFVFFPLFLSCVLCAIWRLENKPSTLKIPSSFDVSTVLPAKSSASTSPSGPCNAHSFSCLCLSVCMYVWMPTLCEPSSSQISTTVLANLSGYESHLSCPMAHTHSVLAEDGGTIMTRTKRKMKQMNKSEQGCMAECPSVRRCMTNSSLPSSSSGLFLMERKHLSRTIEAKTHVECGKRDGAHNAYSFSRAAHFK